MSYLRSYLGNTLITDDVMPHVGSVIRNKALFRYAGESHYCREVEELASVFLRVPHARLVTNGTLALKAALLGLRPLPGQTVLIPAISFIATANAALSCGLVPVLVDVDGSGALCPDSLDRALCASVNRPLAVIAVHLEGTPAPIRSIAALCERHGVHLIEDCAQALGATHGGMAVGTFGDYGCFSFQANKLISSGEGGLLIATDSDRFLHAGMMLDHGAARTDSGLPDWQGSIGFGENGKFNELQAAVMVHQFERVEELCALLVSRYAELCSHLSQSDFVPRPPGTVPVSIWLRRDRIAAHLLRSPLLYDWKAWDLSQHPIISGKLSPYANGFPWNMQPTTAHRPALINHAEVIRQRVCLPVPIDDAIYADVLKLLSGQGGSA
jgi:dTDP-4-amino-4,6-dideoxygalactose transaminase